MLALEVCEDTCLVLLREEDADPLCALVGRNRSHLVRWLPWAQEHSDAASVRDFVRNAVVQALAGTALTFGVWHRGLLVGVADLHDVDYRYGTARIGYWLDRGHQGRGIMTACVRTLLNYAFQALRLRCVEIRVQVGNERSAGIPRRLGFSLKGVFCLREGSYDRCVDMEVYSMTKERWTGNATGE